jgi:hypothetical protein
MEGEMKNFYELDDWKQCELLFEPIERIGTSDVGSLEKLSEKEGKAPQVIWAEMCLARGTAICSMPERVLSAGRA